MTKHELLSQLESYDMDTIIKIRADSGSLVGIDSTEGHGYSDNKTSSKVPWTFVIVPQGQE